MHLSPSKPLQLIAALIIIGKYRMSLSVRLIDCAVKVFCKSLEGHLSQFTASYSR